MVRRAMATASSCDGASPPASSYHTERLRNAPDGYLFHVAREGLGVMPAYGDQLSPEATWQVVAYLRALQLAQHPTEAATP